MGSVRRGKLPRHIDAGGADLAGKNINFSRSKKEGREFVLRDKGWTFKRVMTEHVATGRVSQEPRDMESKSMSSPPDLEASAKEGRDPAVSAEEQTSTDDDDEVYPGDDGDWNAIICMIGCFMALFVGFGILNIPGLFVTYWENNQLSNYTASQVSWIASMQFFLTLFGSVFTGRWFDLHGGKVLSLLKSWLTKALFTGWICRLPVGFLHGQFMYPVLSVLSRIWGTVVLFSKLISGASWTNCKHDVFPTPIDDSTWILILDSCQLSASYRNGIIVIEDSLVASLLQAVH